MNKLYKMDRNSHLKILIQIISKSSKVYKFKINVTWVLCKYGFMKTNLVGISCSVYFETIVLLLVQAGLKLVIHLPQPTKYWEYKQAPPWGKKLITFLKSHWNVILMWQRQFLRHMHHWIQIPNLNLPIT